MEADRKKEMKESEGEKTKNEDERIHHNYIVLYDVGHFNILIETR